MIKTYVLNDGRNLHFSTEHNQLWVGENPEWSYNYYDEDLYSLRIEISHQCNGYCKYCIVFGNNVDRFEKMNITEVWTWLEEQVWFSKISDIFLIGGEPLMFFEDIRYIREQFKGDISLSTNGTLLTNEMADFFADNNVFIYISLDGLREEDNVNRVYRDGTSMYGDIIKGLAMLEQYYVAKGIFMVATHDNIKDIEYTMEQLADQYTITKFGYSIPHWTEHEGDIVSPEEYRDALIRIYKNRKNIKAEIMQVNWRIGPILDGKIKRFSCALHTVQTTLLPDRSIVRCSKIDNDSTLSKTSNEDLNNGCPINRAKDIDSSCRKCIALASCGGGCPYDGMRRFNTIIDQRECVITPALVDIVLADLCEGINKMERIHDGLVDLELISELLDIK